MQPPQRLSGVKGGFMVRDSIWLTLSRRWWLVGVPALTLLGACTDSNSGAVLGPLDASTFTCAHCHADESASWTASRHANTQTDVAAELAGSDTGQAPSAVVQGEDCIACHGPTAVLANGGMSEAQALGYFFTTQAGKVTASTAVSHADAWPQVACAACHDVPQGQSQPLGPATVASFDSRTAKYVAVGRASELCGQCHGSLRFAETDHRTYDAWASSKHGKTQSDVAGELAGSHPGETARQVTSGEDCIACHAPTAVLTNGGMSESEALGYFFTTSGDLFTSGTSVAHTDQWPDVSCTACHDPHQPGQLAYFDSGIKGYIPMASAEQLCGQCHGYLRFPDTDHLSYNIEQGTGGVGVPDQQTMPGVTCTDCHMYVSTVDGSASAMAHGHTFAVVVQESDGSQTWSCQHCHTGNVGGADPAATIQQFKASYASLDSAAEANVAAATSAMDTVTNPALLAELHEAQYNLQYAESDESGGVHNHNYLMALLSDANSKALDLLTK